ncbi:phasin family protein [Ketobacter sp.]|uniref:phasin family protein n=1 Tax=Ketobacter sp. TaxID=2083498 RepID=UPI000F0E0387|nr:phasin family protein [Ketobacter sp.]RLU00267.1 MAG: poly(3-hydroxyalkanoate) granule-associated protein PhaI [Ketobacter sp.]
MSKADDIKRNSTKIWLAGLGAYSMVEAQGSEAFEELVNKGQNFERINHTKEIEVAPDSRLDELKVRANQTMDRIERAFDMRVSSTLGRLGISRKSDLDLLNDKIDRLAAALDKVTEALQNQDRQS